MSNSPYAPPQEPSFQSTGQVSREDLRRVAGYQRLVIFALLVSIAFNIATFFLGGQSTAIQLVILVVALGVAIFSMVSIFLLAKELVGTGIAILCAFLMLIPCVSLITLLVLNQKASTFLQSNGVKVGFFGTSPANI